jgi:hypothetical protein
VIETRSRPYSTCGACACYIEQTELACPFCRAPQVPKAPLASPWARASLAIVSASVGTALAALSCSAAVTPASTSDAHENSGDEAGVADAHHADVADAHRADTGNPTPGAVACGDASCSGETPLCVVDTRSADHVCATETCDGSSLCACFISNGITCPCGDAEGGVVTCRSQSCYGSPPPRYRSRVS